MHSKSTKKRDYKKEYARDHASKKAKTERASRNKARRTLTKSGRVKKGDGKDVDHRDGNPRNNSLEVISKSKTGARSDSKEKLGMQAHGVDATTPSSIAKKAGPRSNVTRSKKTFVKGMRQKIFFRNEERC